MSLAPEEFDAWLAGVGDLPRARLGEGGDHGDTGEPLEPLYSGANVEIDEAVDLGLPGQYPFVRGAYPTGYRQRPWFMTQYAGFGTAESTNQRWKSLLAAGQKAVSLAFDLPSHLGYDSDSELAEDEVGKAGVAIDSLADFDTLFDGIDLAGVPATFNTAAIAPIVVAMYQVTAERRGIPAEKLMGTVTNDPLSSVFRGTTVLPSEGGVRLACDLIEYCLEAMPKFTPINVQGVYMRSVGATKAQEAGYAISFALEYIDNLMKRGLPIDAVASRFSFFFQCDSHFFEEAAKFRAARLVWAETLRKRFQPAEKSLRLRATGVSAARCFTREEPEINLIRGAYSALGCALGGVQGMWISGYDEAYATPTEKASRLALRTMQILAEETGVRAAIDPMGGSWFLEALTKTMADQIRDHIDEVDRHGGPIRASDEGYLRAEMQRNDLQWLRERADGERPVVASNIYVMNDADRADQGDETFGRFDPGVEEDQISRLREVRRTRDKRGVQSALQELRNALDSTANTMPYIVEAVRRYATVGEIMDCAREKFGELVGAESMSPRVLIAKPGLDGHDRGARLIAALLRDAGFEVVYTGIRNTPRQIARAAVAEDVDLVGLSVLAGGHIGLLRKVVDELAALGADTPVVIGGVFPDEDIAVLLDTGAAGVYPSSSSGAFIVSDITALLGDRAGVHAGGEPHAVR